MLAEERLGNRVRKCMLELSCLLLKLAARAELMPYSPLSFPAVDHKLLPAPGEAAVECFF